MASIPSQLSPSETPTHTVTNTPDPRLEELNPPLSLSPRPRGPSSATWPRPTGPSTRSTWRTTKNNNNALAPFLYENPFLHTHNQLSAAVASGDLL